MIRQIQPNAWSCLPTAFAVAIDLPVRDVIHFLGHDGSEIIQEWAHLPDPHCRRNFHMQEMVRLASVMGYAMTPHEPRPASANPQSCFEVPLDRYSPDWESWFMDVLSISRGVLVGETLAGNGHALAWDSGTICDSGGNITRIDDFRVRSFWRVIKSE